MKNLYVLQSYNGEHEAIVKKFNNQFSWIKECCYINVFESKAAALKELENYNSIFEIRKTRFDSRVRVYQHFYILVEYKDVPNTVTCCEFLQWLENRIIISKGMEEYNSKCCVKNVIAEAEIQKANKVDSLKKVIEVDKLWKCIKMICDYLTFYKLDDILIKKKNNEYILEYRTNNGNEKCILKDYYFEEFYFIDDDFRDEIIGYFIDDYVLSNIIETICKLSSIHKNVKDELEHIWVYYFG